MALYEAVYALFTHISRDVQKAKTDRFSVPKAAFLGMAVFQTLGQQLGDASAASPGPLGSSGTVPRLRLGMLNKSGSYS